MARVDSLALPAETRWPRGDWSWLRPGSIVRLVGDVDGLTTRSREFNYGVVTRVEMERNRFWGLFESSVTEDGLTPFYGPIGREGWEILPCWLADHAKAQIGGLRTAMRAWAVSEDRWRMYPGAAVLRSYLDYYGVDFPSGRKEASWSCFRDAWERNRSHAWATALGARMEEAINVNASSAYITTGVTLTNTGVLTVVEGDDMFTTNHIETIDGVVGQVKANLEGRKVIVWQSEPQTDTVDEDGEVTKTADAKALDLAQDEIKRVVKALFASTT